MKERPRKARRRKYRCGSDIKSISELTEIIKRGEVVIMDVGTKKRLNPKWILELPFHVVLSFLDTGRWLRAIKNKERKDAEKKI